MITVRKTKGKKHPFLIIALVVGLYLLYVGIASLTSDSISVESNTVYRLRMDGVLTEQAQQASPFDDLLTALPYGNREKVVGLDQLLRNIRWAKETADVEGIYLDGGSLVMGPAQATELRNALLDFKQSGKFVLAYAHSYGTYNYYVASVADRIFLNPTGSVAWHGGMGAKMYYTRLLDKIGVKVQVLKVGTFKSAVEPFFCTSMSDADRRQTTRFVQGIWDELVDGVALSRGLTAEDLNRMADDVLELQDASTYIPLGIVDSLVYDQSMDEILRTYCGGSKPHLLSTSDMAQLSTSSSSSSDCIAVVYADGEITDDSETGIGGRQFVRLLDEVRRNEDVRAVVLRVNSPGGSADASEQIWHAEQLIREQGLPLVVSMGDYAASGGYYISCSADRIFAQSNTLTGSIGIFGLIPSFAELRDKVGIDIDGIQTNRHSLMFTNMIYRGMSPEETALMQRMIERGYDLFTRRCAEGRHTTQDSIKQIAEGRVWLGRDALDLGLVDSIGSLDDAIRCAASLASLDSYKLCYYPRPKSVLDRLSEYLEPAGEEERLLMHIRQLVSEPRVLTRMPEFVMENR